MERVEKEVRRSARVVGADDEGASAAVASVSEWWAVLGTVTEALEG